MSLVRPETETTTRARTAPANSSPASPRASFQWSGVEIGAYKIGREMARGGMGIVYEARHGQLERVVALKLMRGGAFGDIARFRAETDGRVTLYDFKRGDAFTRRISTGDPIYSMGFLPDGRLATGGADGRLRIWETDADKLIELARETAGRELTAAKRGRFAR